MEPTIRQKIEQGRASVAYERVDAYVTAKKELDEYKAFSRKFPTMIKTNGLGAAVAFTLSKQKHAHLSILDDVIAWLQKDEKKIVALKSNDRQAFLKLVLDLDSNMYRALTNEVLAFMNWHRRFSEGKIKK